MKIRIFEAFAGYGSQSIALQRLKGADSLRVSRRPTVFLAPLLRFAAVVRLIPTSPSLSRVPIEGETRTTPATAVPGFQPFKGWS